MRNRQCGETRGFRHLLCLILLISSSSGLLRADEASGAGRSDLASQRVLVGLVVTAVETRPGGKDKERTEQGREALQSLLEAALSERGVDSMRLESSDNESLASAREQGCGLILLSNLTIEKSKSGKGRFLGTLAGSALGAAFGAAAQEIPVADPIASSVVSNVASDVGSRASQVAAEFATTLRHKDRVTLEYRLSQLDGHVLHRASETLKAETDGSEALSVLVQRVADRVERGTGIPEPLP